MKSIALCTLLVFLSFNVVSAQKGACYGFVDIPKEDAACKAINNFAACMKAFAQQTANISSSCM